VASSTHPVWPQLEESLPSARELTHQIHRSTHSSHTIQYLLYTFSLHRTLHISTCCLTDK